jgi:hypothetical protein
MSASSELQSKNIMVNPTDFTAVGLIIRIKLSDLRSIILKLENNAIHSLRSELTSLGGLGSCFLRKEIMNMRQVIRIKFEVESKSTDPIVWSDLTIELLNQNLSHKVGEDGKSIMDFTRKKKKKSELRSDVSKIGKEDKCSA